MNNFLEGLTLPKILSFAGLLVLALALGTFLGNLLRGPAAANATIGEPAIPFGGTDSSGNDVDLGDYAGDVVVVDFWATWCPPCVAKIPELIALQEEFAGQGVQILGVSGDRTIEDLRRFEEERGINFPTIYGGAHDILTAYGIRAFPTVVIIDREGNVVTRGHSVNIRREVQRLL